ncbi:hypothetical protein [Kitasatospora sp. NPDC006786]|uniref:hypothetical protein n=1 Tax=unclassified Kitasatospora TaxID=2633591 RepID=UPI0033EE9724
MAEVATELYGLPPSEFTAARDTAVAAARRNGDRQLASRIKALHRPTVAAYALNRLVRDHRGEVAGVLELGEALQQAQARLAGPELRELSTRRHRLVAALTARARDAAGAAGVHLAEAQLREVEQSLRAALADEDGAEALAGGCLAAALAEPSSLPEALPERVAGKSKGRLVASAVPGEGGRGPLQVLAGEEREAQRRRAEASATLATAQREHRRAVRDRDRLEQQVQRLAEDRDEALGRVERVWASLDGALEQAAAVGTVLAERETERDEAAARADETGRQVREAKALVDAEDAPAGGVGEGGRVD